MFKFIKRYKEKNYFMEDCDTFTIKDLKLYCPNIFKSINNNSEDYIERIYKKIALLLVSKLFKQNIIDNDNVLIVNAKNKKLVLVTFEQIYIEIINNIASITADNQNSIENYPSNKLHQHAIKYNMIYVLILIFGLSIMSKHITDEALAIVSATAGSAITHLLNERKALKNINQIRKK
jgi:hypothetical protein